MNDIEWMNEWMNAKLFVLIFSHDHYQDDNGDDTYPIPLVVVSISDVQSTKTKDSIIIKKNRFIFYQ